MGKLQSKHAECFLVSADLNKALEDQIWKKKTGFNLANYNMDETLSELSICLEEKKDISPLQVDLPPQKLETDTSKVLTFDHLGIGCHDNVCSDKTKLNIEELECGLHLEGSENTKQEWSFTLYDFDGHGRITKEDLSSVLKALYDAVGSSIKLPPNGARTLKLRLTVGQEPSPGPHNLTSSARSPINKVTKGKVKEFSKLNNLTRTQQVKCINENKTVPSAAPASQGQSKMDCKVQDEIEATTNQIATVPDHRQLADLVHENMERNKIKQLRRHHSDSRNTESHQQKRRQRSQATPSCPLQCPVTSATAALTAATVAKTTACTTEETSGQHEERAKESQDRRNYYLDLAGVENTTSKFQNNPTVPLAGSGCVRTGNGHHRSRSHDNAAKWDNLRLDKCDNVRRECERLAIKHDTAAAHTVAPVKGDCPSQQHPRSKSSDPQDTSTNAIPGLSRSPKSQPKPKTFSGGTTANCIKPVKFRPVSLPGHVPVMVSPHYHRRHRHRDKDHNLAMQQVAQWIEREHTWDIDSDRFIVQRHEHHHIHEHHHHHHYHHYHEA